MGLHVIPVSRIASLSSGEFVGMVADTPAQPIPVKTFCCRLVNELAAPALEELPVLRDVSEDALLANFELIRGEADAICAGGVAADWGCAGDGAFGVVRCRQRSNIFPLLFRLLALKSVESKAHWK